MATGVEIIDAGAVAGRRAGIRTVLDDQRWTLFTGLVVLNVLDLVSTVIVLSRGGDERNPFVQPFVESIWQIGLLKAFVLVLIATLLTRCGESRIAGFALAGTTGWYLAVVSWNVAVLSII